MTVYKRVKCRNHGTGLKITLCLLALAVMSSAAQARLSTRDYTCADVKDLVFQQGAIVLNTKSNSVYFRFVADRSFCKTGERTIRQTVPTKSEKCRLLRCKPVDNERD